MRYLLIGIMILSILVFGCVQETEVSDQNTLTNNQDTIPKTQSASWMNTELTDINTGKTFKINDFKGKPVLIESFAVWCTTCLQQQREIKKFIETDSDSVVHVSIDTDPNEDKSNVQGHIDLHGFDWYFAISPVNMTQELIDEYGLSFVNAPSAPVLLVCSDQTTRFLRSGVKSADDLSSEIKKGC
jgi:cytochrome oxidase Cu insertion factor (SCO1/SenC/PrrC family)